MEPNKIELRSVYYVYENRASPALLNLSIRIPKGEWVWVTGPSGSGKTTLLHLIGGLLKADDSGEMKGSLNVAGRIGMVFQDPEAGIIQPYVEDELAFGPENMRVAPSCIDLRIDAALDDVDMKGMRHTRTDELSGGQKQRIAIASVLTMQPDILLLDEASANLDGPSAVRLMATLRQLHQQGKTIVFASTRLREMEMADEDHLIVLNQGQIVADGAFSKVLEMQQIRLQELGCMKTEDGVEESAVPFVSGSDVANAQPVEPLLEVRRLSFGYRSKHAGKRFRLDQPVINDVNFMLNPGDFLALLGPNGTGKTTLGKLLAGVLTPPKESVFVRGVDIRDDLDRGLAGQVGYVFQNPEHQFVADSVLEECVFGLKMQRGLQPWHQTPPDIAKQGLELLQNAGFSLALHAEMHPYRLHTGAKRMLSIVSMLITEPDVLVLDEPTAGLDFLSAEMIMAACATYAQQGKAVVMITHDTQFVHQWANKKIILQDSMHI